MEAERAVAIVGLGAILPDAPDVPSFWRNLSEGRYSISGVTDRWSEALYFDPDPKAPDKTYTKIGGWVREYAWDPMGWRMPIPPRVGDVMDPAQKWAVAASRQALLDYGYPDRPLDPERVAVILGNALGGDFHLLSAARILFPEVGDELAQAPSFQGLPAEVRAAVMEELVAGVRGRIPDITEDTMPGELGNIVAGRVAALFDFKGPNYIADAACASAMAAMTAAVDGLLSGEYDAVLTGGIDANMSASTFVKFCKIGALSATGSRPYAEGADGFVMGEGGSVFLMKRLSDAERDGDRVYAVLLGTGGSSDGKGKGITAPNPAGQKFAVTRAWARAGETLQPGDMIEGHGTSTKVGDVVEVETMHEAFGSAGLPVGSVALGSAKSNIGHLKGGAGAAGVMKATLALHHRMLPPSANFPAPNPNIDFGRSFFRVNTELRPWEKPGTNGASVRRAGVSAFGFGGTNFHVVMEEYVPGRHRRTRAQIQGAELAGPVTPLDDDASTGFAASSAIPSASAVRVPLRGALVVGGVSDAEVASRLREIAGRAAAGEAPVPAPPRAADLRAPVRVAVDYGSAAELADLAGKAVEALEAGDPGRWRALRNKGVFVGRGVPGKVAFLFTGQGSQYVGMLEALRDSDPVVAETFAEADRVMTPILGEPLTRKIFVDGSDAEAVARAEEGLKQTAITQPAVLTVDIALARLLGSFGVEPDMVMGHSLGEYGALVASGAMAFGDALAAVAARGDAMTKLSIEDNGVMAAVFGPLDEVTAVVEGVDGYVVVANVNSTKECVIGGTTEAVGRAMDALKAAGYRVAQLPVSHAFHTEIVSPASDALRKVLSAMPIRAPRIPVVANVDASFYPTGEGVAERMVDILGRQIGSPVQFVKGLNALYDAGARVFVEVGPKRALYAMADDVVGERDGVTIFFTNHPRTGDVQSVNRALCGLYAQGLGAGVEDTVAESPPVARPRSDAPSSLLGAPARSFGPAFAGGGSPTEEGYAALGHLVTDFLDRALEVYQGSRQPPQRVARIGITGAALGLPGGPRVFGDDNVARILRGEGMIGEVPGALRTGMLDRRVTRLVKGPNGEARFETIEDPADVIKLAGRAGSLDLVDEFGFPEDRLAALDWVTRLAIAAGLDALRDAGIPLVRRYKKTSTGSELPVGWALPEPMRDDTAIVFGSAFPGYDQLVRAMEGYHEDRARRQLLEELRGVRAGLTETRVSDPVEGGPRSDSVEDVPGSGAVPAAGEKLDRRIEGLEKEIEESAYHFDRRFLFQVLAMGHAQFAEYIGARGPALSLNAACATGTQAIAVAGDLIRAGRCRRALVVTADDITTDAMFPWFGSGFLASGAAATDARVEDAALPFDRRRHGLIIGMGGAALIVEDLDAASERGVAPICEVMGTVVANSAFHGSRLDVEHIVGVMERLVSDVEARWGVDRHALARETVFVSHETYTPARGGSASAEVRALRHVFGADADAIVVANTKGYTGHPMGVGIEDALAVKMLETGIVPPVANFRDVDPELGVLNLSRGGSYPIRYALRLAAGFGSQISMSLLRWSPPPDGARRRPDDLDFRHRIADSVAWQRWLREVTHAEAPELEVVRRTLRVKDDRGAVVRPAAPAETSHAAVTPVDVASPGAAHTEGVPVADVLATSEIAAGGVVEPAPAPAATATTSVDAVAQRVLAIVSEQTGYPPDMLELDLDLEADLGIDTVKQAEMFAAIRAAYDIERDENLALRDYPTLARAIEFVYEKRPDLGAGAVAAAEDAIRDVPATSAAVPTLGAASDVRTASVAPAGGAPAAASVVDPVAQRVLAIVSEQTGYPPDMLELDLDLEADLGIDTVKQAEMFAAIRAAYDIERDENLALRDYPTLARAIEFVYEKRPDLRAGTAAAATAEGAAGDVRAASTSPAVGATTAASTGPVAAVAGSALAGAAPPSAPTATGAPASLDPVAQRVLAIVSEQTGYPPDMLELDLDLEADLGIDTVKQAEMFAAIRAAYAIERDENLALRDYPTLARAIEFVYEKRPDLRAGTTEAPVGASSAVPEVPPTSSAAPTSAAPVGADVAAASSTASTAGTPTREPSGLPRGSADAAKRVPRRVPIPYVRPSAERFPATGVTLDAEAVVVIVPDEGGVGLSLADRLRKMDVDVLVADPSSPTDVLVEEILAWRAERKVRGVYWLPALDGVLPPELTDPADRAEALRRRVKALHAIARTLYDDLGEPGAFLVAGTRLGGQHGYDREGALEPAGGAVTGFTKALARERPTALVKAVDFEASRKTAALADILMGETLRDRGAVEVGHAKERRWSVALEERPLETGVRPDGEALPPDGVHVVTGAAGSIVSAIVADLAATAHGGTYWLLDLAPEPDRDDPDLARVLTDRDGLKRDLFERLRAEEERVTPVRVERELAGLERGAAALAAIRAIEVSGGTVQYRSLDLRDSEAVAGVVGEIVATHGRVDVLLHAAGLEISRTLPDKTPEEFARVFDVKVEGWFNLMVALTDVPIGTVMTFSSIAGRFGNAGQTDYAAANDLLCKAVSALSRTRPETRAISLDWTAWRDIGMAARGSIPQIMAAAGIDMLAPEAGIAVVSRELSAGGRGEAVIADGLGAMLYEDPEAARLDDTFAGAAVEGTGPMIGRVVAYGLHGGLVVETDLDPRTQPFLDDHRIDGTAVLPGVMGLEGMAEAACLPFPDLHVVALEDVSFDAPFKFYRDEPRTVTVSVQYVADGEDVLARCRVTGARLLAGRDHPEVTTHFSGTVRLRTSPPSADREVTVPLADAAVVDAEAIYETYFHGPAYQVIRDAWQAGGTIAGRFARDLPANHHPAERPTLVSPRLVELAFQTAGLAEIVGSERMGLPFGFDRLELHRSGNGELESAAVVHPRADDAFDVEVSDTEGRMILSLEGYRTAALPGRVEAAALGALRS